MNPYLKIGIISVPTFGLCIVLGVFACIAYMYTTLYYREHENDKTIIRAFIVFIPALGALWLFAFMFDGLFHSIQNGKLSFGGITWEGGILGCFAAYILIAHFFIREKSAGDTLSFFSLIVPGIVIGHAFGRVGCFFGGCCYGVVTDSPLGVVFPDGSLADIHYPNAVVGSLPVLPTQLFESAFELILFSVMFFAYKRIKYKNLEIYCISYGIFRFILEFWRGDNRGATGFFLSPSQAMSIVLFLIGIAIVVYKLKNALYKPQRFSSLIDACTIKKAPTKKLL